MLSTARVIFRWADALAVWIMMTGGTNPRSATASSSHSNTSYPVPRASSPRSWSRLGR